jgi:hypothetical protein
VTEAVVRNVGLGLDGILLGDLKGASAKKKWALAYVKALIKADKGGIAAHTAAHGSDNEAKMFQLMRDIRGLFSAVTQEEGGAPGASPKITVVANSEEAVYSMDFQPTDLEDAQKMIRIMYGRPFSVLVVPKHSVLKKIVYSIKVDMKMVGIDRVSMASLAAGPSDTALLRLRRYLVGHMLACAGTALVPGAMYDGGFGGVHASFPTQYLSWFDCCDLLETFETSVACLAEPIQESLVETLIKRMAHSSGTGFPRPSASCVVGRAVHEVISMVGSAQAVEHSLAALGKRRLDEDPPLETGGGALLGPNGLEKMKGGNPAGEPCKDFAKGRCPRPKCSFAHAKKQKVAPTPPAEEGQP